MRHRAPGQRGPVGPGTADAPARREALRCALCALLLASPLRGTAQPAAGSTLGVGFVSDFAPFVIGRRDDPGILVDLAREALRRAGYAMSSRGFPSKRFDLDPLSEFPGLAMFVGTPLVHRADCHYVPIYAFDNVAASLTSDKLRIHRVEDLEGKTVVAFNNASNHLKEPFSSFHARRLRHSPLYSELENMASIVSMLINRHAQVALIDRSFLKYYARLDGHPDLAGITTHEIFPLKNIIYAVTKDAVLASRTRESLASMQADGWVDRMLKKYL